MEVTTFNILNISAKPAGWVHRGTYEAWLHVYPSMTVHANYPVPGKEDAPPDLCTFWFHLSDDEDEIVGFDWNSSNPNIVRTVSGGFPTTTPINLSYVSSQKKLGEFFAKSKDKAHKIQKKRREWLSKKSKPTFFSKVWKVLNKELI